MLPRGGTIRKALLRGQTQAPTLLAPRNRKATIKPSSSPLPSAGIVLFPNHKLPPQLLTRKRPIHDRPTLQLHTIAFRLVLLDRAIQGDGGANRARAARSSGLRRGDRDSNRAARRTRGYAQGAQRCACQRRRHPAWGWCGRRGAMIRGLVESSQNAYERAMYVRRALQRKVGLD